MLRLFDKNMEEIKLDINEYQEKIFPLDNFSAVGLKMDDVYFPTGEHAFQYLKYKDTNIDIANKILNSYSPNEARNIGSENKEYRIKNWNEVKYDYLERVFRLKLEQNEIVKNALLNTKDYDILESCIDEDTEWGVDRNNNGENILGKTWMKIRNNIK